MKRRERETNKNTSLSLCTERNEEKRKRDKLKYFKSKYRETDTGRRMTVKREREDKRPNKIKQEKKKEDDDRQIDGQTNSYVYQERSRRVSASRLVPRKLDPKIVLIASLTPSVSNIVYKQSLPLSNFIQSKHCNKKFNQLGIFGESLTLGTNEPFKHHLML
jgi:hypothetical protein